MSVGPSPTLPRRSGLLMCQALDFSIQTVGVLGRHLPSDHLPKRDRRLGVCSARPSCSRPHHFLGEPRKRKVLVREQKV